MMKKNKILKSLMLSFLFCILFAGLIPITSQASEEKELKSFPLKVVMKREDWVKLRLTEENVSKYVIYRADAKADGTLAGSYKKLMTIHATNVSYMDKIQEGNYYSYKVYGYEKVNGKNIQTKVGQRLVYGGHYTMWDEYQHCDAKITPEQIPLRLNIEEEYTPDGYVIYRKEEGGRYEKLVKIETSDRYIEYVDKDVETGKSYFYRARAYHYVKGKKVFAIYTNPVRMSAVNRIGIYRYEMLTPANEQTTGLKMKVTSDVNNDKLVMKMGSNSCTLSYYTEYGYGGEEIDVAMYLAEYSYDNENWTGFTEKEEELVIHAGETIYLRFKDILGHEFTYLGEEALSDTNLICEEVKYNYLTSALWFGYGSFSAEVIGEYYH